VLPTASPAHTESANPADFAARAARTGGGTAVIERMSFLQSRILWVSAVLAAGGWRRLLKLKQIFRR
jgi:hypothetical protein